MKAIAEKYFLDYYPGAVQFSFYDIYDKKWTITEKLPILGIDVQEDERYYPKEIVVPLKVLESYQNDEGKEVCKVKLLHSIETDNGISEFLIFTENIQKTRS